MRKIIAALCLCVSAITFATFNEALASEVLQTNEYQITFDLDAQSTPVVCHDAVGDYIAYTSRPLVNGAPGPADIYYQRLDNGQPVGEKVAVATSAAEEILGDCSGDYIVYLVAAASGTDAQIILYQISTGQSRALTALTAVSSPKIYGDAVVWIQMAPYGAQAVMYSVSSGVPVQAVVIAGPVPPVLQLDVGDRFIVWSQSVGGQLDVAAYDMITGVTFAVADDPGFDERSPSTDSAWIAYEAVNRINPAGVDILAVNLDTWEVRTVAKNGALNQHPRISGNLISYESNVAGNWDIYVYRIEQKDTYQVTTRPDDQHLNDIVGNVVTYVDSRNGNDDVFASVLSFVTAGPVAAAGLNQLVHAGQLVTLDGSGSYDSSGHVPLTYAWRFTARPAGSTAALANPTSVSPTFTADVLGDYVVQLVVTNSVGQASSPATVTISTVNTPPVASAGPDQAITTIGATVQLNGGQSFDVDGDPLTYEWSFVSKPLTSAAALSNTKIVNPTFVADVHGTYVVQLIVRDGWSQSAPAQVTISFENVKPVANAGLSQSTIVGHTVTLDGSGSHDANGDPLSYKWSFTAVPAGSTASIASPTSVITTFAPDLPGLYVAELIVNDGFVNSEPSTVQVEAVTVMEAGERQTKDIQTALANLGASVFRNPTMQNALIDKLNEVLANISSGKLKDAINQLQNDILPKIDGCVTAGAPDKNDWITNCEAQAKVYPLVVRLIGLLNDLSAKRCATPIPGTGDQRASCPPGR